MADKGYLALFLNHTVQEPPPATRRGRLQASHRRLRAAGRLWSAAVQPSEASCYPEIRNLETKPTEVSAYRLRQRRGCFVLFRRL